MNKFFLAMLLAIAIPSLATAGGNSKATGFVRFINTTSNTAFVVINPPAGVSFEDFDSGAFADIGGRVIPPNGSTTFPNVRSGKNSYGFAFGNDTGPTGEGTRKDVTVRGGKTVTVSLR